MYVWGLRLLIKMATHFSHVCIHTLHAYRHAKSLQSCLTLCDPMYCNPSRLLCPWDSPAKNSRVGCHSLSPGNLPNPGIEPKSHVSCIGRQVLDTTSTIRKPTVHTLQSSNQELESVYLESGLAIDFLWLIECGRSPEF